MNAPLDEAVVTGADEALDATQQRARYAEPLPRPDLSICIPTRNRAELLQLCLARLASSPILNYPAIRVEIVVVDNASQDRTQEVLASAANSLPLRGYRQRRSVDIVANIFAAHRLAQGEFCVYLADDDELQIPALARAVEWMRAHPQAVAAFPGYFEVNPDGSTAGKGQNVAHEILFERGDFEAALAFFMARMHHPEIAVVRSAAFRRVVSKPEKTFYGYHLFAQLLGAGDVGMLPEVTHRHNIRGPAAAVPNEQYKFAIDRMDECRLGYELLMLRCMEQKGWRRLPEAILHSWQSFLTIRMAEYAEIACRLAVAGGRPKAGVELAVRSAVWGGRVGELYELEDATWKSRVTAEIVGRESLPEDVSRCAASMEAAEEMVAAGVDRADIIPIGAVAGAVQVFR